MEDFEFTIDNSVEWLDENYEESINPYKLEFPSNTVICGITNSQKTTIAMHILKNNYKNFNRILVATTNLEDYSKILDKEKILLNPTLEVIDNIIKYQERHKKTKTLLILDDLIGSINMGRNNVFDKLATMARHLNLSLIFIVQHISSISTIIRNNSKYLFITHVKLNNLEKLFEMIDGFESFNEFRDFYKINNKEYVAFLFCLFRSNKPYIVFNVDKPPKFYIKQK